MNKVFDWVSWIAPYVSGNIGFKKPLSWKIMKLPHWKLDNERLWPQMVYKVHPTASKSWSGEINPVDEKEANQILNPTRTRGFYMIDGIPPGQKCSLYL